MKKQAYGLLAAWCAASLALGASCATRGAANAPPLWARDLEAAYPQGEWLCAVETAAVLNKKLARKATISLLGGDLELEWNEENNHIYMTGDAVTVFEGEWNDDKN